MIKEKKIDDLVYDITWAKNKELPQPIFLIGAGVSASADIPLANEIVDIIINEHKEHPSFKDLKEEDKKYQIVMGKINPLQRKEILKPKFEEIKKINLAHIYLAQLIQKKYIDYIFTTNFDNLMIKALMLFNINPPIYDIAPNIDLTTTTIEKGSIVYLHGLYPGIQLLNSDENLENENIKRNINKIFNSVTDRRTWIIMGYSGKDPVFKRIKELGNFDNNLYWVINKYDMPDDKDVLEFLENTQKNVFVIKGFDADSFMMYLNNKLELKQPLIIDKPFSALKNILNFLKETESEERFDLFKKPLKTSKSNVEEAINKYEKEKEIENLTKENSEKIKLLKKQVSDIIILGNFSDEIISPILKEADKFKQDEIKDSLSSLYFNWGYFLDDISEKKEGKESEELLKKAIEKYEKAIEIKPDKHEAFNNLGIALKDLSKKKEGKESEDLLNKAIEKYEKAIEIKPDIYEAIFNLGIALTDLSKKKDGEESEELLKKAKEIFGKAIEIKPDVIVTYSNLVSVLYRLANKKETNVQLELIKQAEKYIEKALTLNPSDYDIACFNSLRKNKKDALKLLDSALNNKEITKEHVLDDYDWEHYLNDEDFKNIINKY